MNNKIKNIIDELNISLVERQEHTRLALLTSLAGENLILVGPPGTAKSEISRRISDVFDTKYFEYLLTKFTTPEELFGPVSIKELENDSFKRRTDGYLSDANIVFLDEIFKANSSILNSLLTILNEKIYHNGNTKEKTDIYSIISASNELPTEEEELIALYDRFLMRVVVDYVKNPRELLTMKREYKGITNKINKEELENIRLNREEVSIPEHIVDIILGVKGALDDEFKDDKSGIPEKISDRRLVKSLELLKTSAYTNERDYVSIVDLLLLKNCYWNRMENKDAVEGIIVEEILKIKPKEIETSKEIARVWTDEFDSLFCEQRVDEEGKPLYYNIDRELVRESIGDRHVTDKYGDYLHYLGHSEYVKVLAEAGKFDHGYIDSGHETSDGKIVWTYEFSPVQVINSKKDREDGFERLVVKGDLPKAMIESYIEYVETYGRIKPELISRIKGIKRNVEDERVILRRNTNYLESVVSSLENTKNIWLWEGDLEEVLTKSKETYEVLRESLDEVDDLLRKIDIALR